MDQGHRESQIGAIGAISGAVLLAVGTYLHPVKSDPNDATRAFAEYAADHLWVASHLTHPISWCRAYGSCTCPPVSEDDRWPRCSLGSSGDCRGDRKSGHDFGTPSG